MKLDIYKPFGPLFWTSQFQGFKLENPNHSQKCLKYLYSALSTILVIFFMFICFRIGITTTESRLTREIESWRQRAIEAEKVKDDVERAVKEIKETRKRIEEEEAYKLAVKYTASAYAYEIPVAFVLACVKMETGYNPDCVGPFQEREDFQIYRPSFARFFPASEWHNRQKRYVAGLQHYVICVKIAQRVYDDPKNQILLSLALHNSGYLRRDPKTAFKAAHLHMKRAQRLRIWELADGGSSA
jgi:hypothetical protein